MEQVLRGLHWKTALLYLDDVIVIAPDFRTHLDRLAEVLQRLQQAGLKLKPKKCELLQTEVKYLGHLVSAEGIATDPEKVEAIREWPRPTCVRDLQAFLGTAGYYRQYLPDFATVAKPLHHLTSKGVNWEWTAEAQAAFDELRQRLIGAPVLGYPDPGLQYILDTDASDVGVGAVLSQIQEGQERVIAFYSKTLSPAERNYCVTRRELVAVIKAIKHFRPYLYGQKFRLRTDHASLMWLCRRQEPSHQIARWLELLSEFTYTVEHRKGTAHGNADGLSRRGCVDCKQCERIEQRDGGPTHQQLHTDTAGYTSQCPEKVEPHQSRHPTTSERAEGIARVEQPPSPTELAKLQRDGTNPVALVYRSIAENQELGQEILDLGGRELKQLYQRRHAMRLSEHGVLQIRVCPQGVSRWCAVCPPGLRRTMVWQTHDMAHSGAGRTLSRVQLVWYWPGMTTEIRQVVRSCEVCQAAKSGGTQATGSRQRLFAGRPWQKVAVDLVGPMPETSRGNKWILVLMDHFTRWQDAIPLIDATAPVVASTLDERVFCYLGLPEQLHTDQGAQFESQLLAELCHLWKVAKTRTTPYHPQANGMVERNNRLLGDSLRAMLLNRGQEDWDLVLPQIMRAFRGTPHTVTGETPNLMMLGRELRLPDQLLYTEPPTETTTRHQYVIDMKERLEVAHSALQERQIHVRHEDEEEPPLFAPGDLVWLENKRRKKGENPKLQPKFIGPYHVLEVCGKHTYKLERQGQISTQHESRLKAHKPCPEATGQAPTRLEPSRRPNMKGAINRKKSNTEETLLSDNPTIPALPPSEMAKHDESETRSPTNDENQSEELNEKLSSQPSSQEDNSEIAEHSAPRRSSRNKQLPDRYGNAFCHTLLPRSEIKKPNEEIKTGKILKDYSTELSPVRKKENEPCGYSNFRTAENAEMNSAMSAKGNEDRSFSCLSAKKKSCMISQPEENYLVKALTTCFNMSDDKPGKDDNFLEELMQFLAEDDKEMENNEEIKNNCEQLPSPVDHVVPNRADVGPNNTDSGTVDGPDLVADPLNGTPGVPSEGVQPQTQSISQTKGDMNVVMEVELTRVSEPQPDIPSTGAAQNPGQCSNTVHNNADRNDIEAAPNDTSDVTNKFESVKVVIPNQIAQISTSVSTADLPTGPRVSGRVARKDPPPQGAPSSGRLATDSNDDNVSPSTAIVGEREPVEEVLEIEAAEGESLSDTESTHSSSSASSSTDSATASSTDRDEPEQMDDQPPVEPVRPPPTERTVRRLPERTEWVQEATTTAIRNSIERTEGYRQGRCRVCGFRGALRRVRVHIKQHRCRYFCPCTLNSVSRDSIYEHQKRHSNRPGTHYPLYTVDETSYPTFCRAMGWSQPPAFQPCIPTRGAPPARDGSARPSRDPRPPARDPARQRADQPRQQRRRSPQPPRDENPPRRARTPETRRHRQPSQSLRRHPQSRPSILQRLGRRQTTPHRMEEPVIHPQHREVSRRRETTPRRPAELANRPPHREVVRPRDLTPPRPREPVARSPPREALSAFRYRDYRLDELSLEDQRRIVVRRLGWTPLSHDDNHPLGPRNLDDYADTLEREIAILRREPRRAPASPRTQRILDIQVDSLTERVRRYRAAARTLRGAPSPPPKRRRN